MSEKAAPPKASPNDQTSSLGKVLYFRRRRHRSHSFLVHVVSVKEEYCTAFNDLDEALDFMEDEEARHPGVDCHLFQWVPTEDHESV